MCAHRIYCKVYKGFKNEFCNNAEDLHMYSKCEWIHKLITTTAAYTQPLHVDTNESVCIITSE
jgi:hypothetical protein